MVHVINFPAEIMIKSVKKKYIKQMFEGISNVTVQVGLRGSGH